MLQITIDGTDISSYLISYTREKDLCSSEGIVELEVDTTLSISTYDLILTYEDSNLKGTFYVDSLEKFPDGRMTVHGRDNSKRAQDYFIPESFTALGDTSSRYWIEYFLGMAGISYNFTTVDTGYTIQDGEVLGLTSVQEIVEQLVRYSGWYIYYDASNVAQIGKLNYDSTSYTMAFDDTDIVTINYNRSDMYLRNRAVVWGAGYKGDQEWVFADISVDTPWNYDTTDKRAILARAGFPIPYSQAMGTAQILLNEYARLVQEKTITLHGFHDLEIGEFVLINSSYFNGVGLISQINVTTTEDSGYKTTLVLDRRCPRFVGFYDIGGLVYAGTEADGIWHKTLSGSAWTNYSTGLADLNINDLDVSYGVMSTTTAGEGYLYGRTVGDAAWIRLQPSYYYDSVNLVSYPAGSGMYVASNINDYNQTIYGLFTISGSSPRTWLSMYPSVGGTPTNVLVTMSGETKYLGIDVESTFEDVYLSVVEQGGGGTTPMWPVPEGTSVGFSSPAELFINKKITTTGTDNYKCFGVSGNYMYIISPIAVYRYNFIEDSWDTIEYIFDDFITYIPKTETIGYYVCYDSTVTLFIILKVDWDSLSIQQVASSSYAGISDIFPYLGTAKNGEEIVVALGGRSSTAPYDVHIHVFYSETDSFSTVISPGTGYIQSGCYWAMSWWYNEPPDFTTGFNDGMIAFSLDHDTTSSTYTTRSPYMFFLDASTTTPIVTSYQFPFFSLGFFYDVDDGYKAFLGPDHSSGDVIFVGDRYSWTSVTNAWYRSVGILKIKRDGTFTELVGGTFKRYVTYLSTVWNPPQVISRDDKTIVRYNDRFVEYYYDATNEIELSKTFTVPWEVCGNSLGPLGEVFALSGPGTYSETVPKAGVENTFSYEFYNATTSIDNDFHYWLQEWDVNKPSIQALDSTSSTRFSVYSSTTNGTTGTFSIKLRNTPTMEIKNTSGIYVQLYDQLGQGANYWVRINGTKYYNFTTVVGGTTSTTIYLDVGTEITDFAIGTDYSYINPRFHIHYIRLPIIDVEKGVVSKILSDSGERYLFKDPNSLVATPITPTFIAVRNNLIWYTEGDGVHIQDDPFIIHAMESTGGGNTGRILRYRNGSFESVYALAGAHFNLDISSPSVITAYTGVATSGLIYLDGSPYSTGSSRGDVYFSFAGDYGTFRHINLPTMSGSYIFDSRGFSLIDEAGNYRTCIGMVVLSGLFGSVGQFSYIDVTEYEEGGSVIVFPDIHTVQTFDYVPVALETSNYNYMNTPYFFVGLKDTATPFLQRDADTADFINRSTNFPASRITTIRLDDML